MRTLPLFAGLFLLELGVLHAGFSPGWDSIILEPGAVEVVNMKPVPIVEGKEKNSWLHVPDALKENTQVFIENGKASGVADFTATKEGWVLIACDYSYQGNRGGNWQETRWEEKDFQAHGWRKLAKNELGGLLIDEGNHELTVFTKRLKVGESGRLRCNKYHPPQFILLPAR